jgi:predicted nucleic acid-binding protein
VTNFTIDTNILIYSIDSTDPAKHVIARTIVVSIYSNGGILPLQCLSEFCAACTKKKHLGPIQEIEEAAKQAIRSMRMEPSASEDLLTAMRFHRQHHIQFFDALLIATARRAGCTVFLSEDLQDGRNFDGITVRNPFRLSNEELGNILS